MAEIIIPGQFRQYSTVDAIFMTNERTAGEALEDLTRTHPMLKSYIFESDHTIKGFVNIFVDGEMTEDLSTPVFPSTRIQIILAVAGG
ncbi:MoaD/ThiS family protein [Salmonella enterica]|nr:MoaD/ThiS family protein [Salmonella enterica]EKC2597423.1 MoaD/ThiS family protein [Salmonella enterica]EMD3507976.1 MoaD/ThiS family protein [Salmonella enterica]EMD4682140.1 MoaD/ThiS family protein [Salmonella enterica]EMD4827697.1 MoaD/ThiS family protein [Salmonella enterica]